MMKGCSASIPEQKYVSLLIQTTTISRRRIILSSLVTSHQSKSLFPSSNKSKSIWRQIFSTTTEKMSIITLQEIKVLKNPTKFTDKFEFEITFNAVEKLDGDIEWKLIYVGSPDSSDYDQVLDTVLVGPVPKGKNKFSFSVCCFLLL